MTSTSTPGNYGSLTPGHAATPAQSHAATPALTPALDALSDALATELDKVESVLDASVNQAYRFADETSHHLMRAGGKRIRPTLVLLCSYLGNGPSPRVHTAAAAIELVHLASLYHDDVMDDATIRRGAVSANAKWGNNVAILTGDILFARASSLSLEVGEEAMAVQAHTFERLVLGQLNEFVGPAPTDDPIEHYLSVLSDKTGSLISAACQFGLIASNAPREYRQIVRSYGESVGIAFQLADDVIDLTSDSATTGKTPGTDLREGVATLPVLYARQAAARGDLSAAEVVARVDADLTSDTALEAARQALAGHPVVERTRSEATAWANRAVDALADLPDGEVKTGLTDFARRVVERVS